MSAARPKRTMKTYEPRGSRLCKRCTTSMFSSAQYCDNCRDLVTNEVKVRYRLKRKMAKKIMTREEIQKLISPAPDPLWTCPICSETYLHQGGVEICLDAHLRDEAKLIEEAFPVPDPEPDEGLVSLMEAMENIKYESKD